ncbi:AT-hook motif nuclear-localized protein 7-like [Andrographis paniculata]|uniref:AT-hook motif nuclear-localized protein 7-like n=1 Tax=Andrographis paniculata TaxID=175694 RepID=UPI0021E951D5|nr:AT-hook motif nuclear-localized protein 7-like [Andrographis paniculata]
MEMEDKDSADYGSPGGSSEVHSQPSSGGAYDGQESAAVAGATAPEIMNAAANIGVEKNAGAVTSPAVASGAGAIGGSAAAGGGTTAGSGDLLGKKKRGRPRKYDSEGNLSAAYLRSKTAAAAAAAQNPSQPGFTLSTPPSYEFPAGPKKGRKSSGFGNWQALAALGELFTNTAGGDFTPHVVTVHTGEDVAGKILTFAQKGSRGVCVLSANGCVSNVTIRQPGSSGGLLTYEGRFEILTLTGSYTISDNGGIRSRTGGLSVSLASPDGRVIGGGVAGLLMAASPIQIVVGSFVPNGYKFQKKKPNAEPRSASPTVAVAAATVTAAVPLSQAPPETNIYTATAAAAGRFGFAVQQSHQGGGGEAENSLSNKEHPNSTSTDTTTEWNGSRPSSEPRPYPDINLSIPVEEH